MTWIVRHIAVHTTRSLLTVRYARTLLLATGVKFFRLLKCQTQVGQYFVVTCKKRARRSEREQCFSAPHPELYNGTRCPTR